jgi:hypothetical protein
MRDRKLITKIIPVYHYRLEGSSLELFKINKKDNKDEIDPIVAVQLAMNGYGFSPWVKDYLPNNDGGHGIYNNKYILVKKFNLTIQYYK